MLLACGISWIPSHISMYYKYCAFHLIKQFARGDRKISGLFAHFEKKKKKKKKKQQKKKKKKKKKQQKNNKKQKKKKTTTKKKKKKKKQKKKKNVKYFSQKIFFKVFPTCVYTLLLASWELLYSLFKP